MKLKRGFTLLELLIVIGIIGILAGIVYANLNLARSKYRDSVRKSDLNSFRNALELYHIDHGTYPVTPLGVSYSSLGDITGYIALPTGTTWNPSAGINQLVPDNISFLPLDPSNSASNYNFYTYKSCEDGTGYVMWILLESGKRYQIIGGTNGALKLADVNNDSLITTLDLSPVSMCAGGTSKQCLFRADFNMSGQVDPADVAYVNTRMGLRCDL